MKEQFICIPIEPSDKNALKAQATANGRAMMREAAVLVHEGLRKRRRNPRREELRWSKGGAK